MNRLSCVSRRAFFCGFQSEGLFRRSTGIYSGAMVVQLTTQPNFPDVRKIPNHKIKMIA